MVDDAKAGKKKVSFWLDQEHYDAMERLARDRGDNAVS